MPEIDREGIFKVAPGAETAIEDADSGAVCAVFKFRITDALINGNWEDWSEHGFEAYARLWFIKKNNGGLNTTAVETMRDVLGWDGSIESISNGTWEVPACQITVKNEPYKGQDRFKVSYINPFDYSGKLNSANPDAIAKIQSLYGSQLRALCGAKAVTPPKPAGKPGLPPPPKRRATGKDDAWQAFLKLKESAPSFDDDYIASEWNRIGVEMFGDRFASESLSTADWLKLKTEGPGRVIPF